jgi:hypothetical protein
LPPWLSIAHDPALHTISWYSQRAPAGVNETFLITVTATIGANHSLAHNSSSFTLATLFPPPNLNLDFLDTSKTSYKVGDPTISHPLDAETASRCSKNYENCELRVVPISGSRFIKLRANYDSIDF